MKMKQNLASHIFFLKKKIKVFQKRSKSKFLRFMTKVNPEKGNETRHLTWDMFKSDIFHWSQDTKTFQ